MHETRKVQMHPWALSYSATYIESYYFDQNYLIVDIKCRDEYFTENKKSIVLNHNHLPPVQLLATYFVIVWCMAFLDIAGLSNISKT